MVGWFFSWWLAGNRWMGTGQQVGEWWMDELWTYLAETVWYGSREFVAREIEVLQVVAVAYRVWYRPLEHIVEQVEHAKVGHKA